MKNSFMKIVKLSSLLWLSLLFNLEILSKHEIMSYDEYVTVKHESPYMFTILRHDQVLFYFGANHSCDPSNQQYEFLKYFWNEFLACTQGKNCVVLVEGSLRGHQDNENDAITKSGGEGGLLTYFADQQKITVLCPEPDQEYLNIKLLQQFSAEEIAYRRFGHIGQQYHRYKKNNPKLNFEEFYDRYQTGISFDQMKVIHAQIFDTELDVENERWFYDVSNPVVIKSSMNMLARAASAIRDEAIVNYIAELKLQGKNIFIVYGATHAVMQKKAIKKMYEDYEK